MKKLPFVENSYKALHDMVIWPIRSKLLMTGIEVGIFDEMEEFRLAGDIAALIETHPENTEKFLNALATIGLVEKRNGLYRNRPESSAFLVRNSPTCLGPFFQMVQRMCVDTLEGLGNLIKDGPYPETGEKDFASEDHWAEATRTSAGWVIGGVGQEMAAIVSDLPEFSGFRKMLDLGGGHGMFALYFVQAHSSMTGVVFDRPAVVSVAERFIREWDMQERVSVMPGDYLTGDIGEGYDFIWACSTLNFARHDLDPLIRKIFDGLNPGGIFISFQDGMTHEQTRPDTMLGHLGDALRMGLDICFDQGEICEAMLRCGFRSVRSQTLETPMGEMDLDIARK
jgi:predicted O-methyltransferase YrrM